MGELLAAILSPLLEVGKWIYGKFQKPDPVQVLKRREELRREFEEHLPIIYCRLKDGQPYESVPFFGDIPRTTNSWLKLRALGRGIRRRDFGNVEKSFAGKF